VQKKSIYRGFLITAGLLAALVIILSHGYSLPADNEKQSATEQTDEHSKTISAAPTDAVPQGSLVRVDENVPVSILEILGEPQSIQNFIPRSEAVLSNLFKVLFRVVIAPNAP
jgi:hypothetical protein